MKIILPLFSTFSLVLGIYLSFGFPLCLFFLGIAGLVWAFIASTAHIILSKDKNER